MDSITTSQLDLARLRKVIQQALSLPENSVISGWLPQGQRYPAYFVTVDLSSSQEIGQSRRQFSGEIEIITTSCLSTLNISAYGENALKLTQKLRTLLQSSALIDAFKAMHCGIVSFSAVRNLSATLGGGYEERGQFDLVISHEIVVEVPLAPIEQVDITTNHFIKQVRKA